MQRSYLKAGVIAGLPIFIGYLPIAIAFGLLAKVTGLNFVQSLAFSIFVYAGASQFIALNLLQTGAAQLEIVTATLLLNLRHLLMSTSLAARLERKTKGLLPWIAFGVTDESFSVAATREGKLDPGYLLALNFTAYLGWVGGTAGGFWVGAALPKTLQQSMGITLYAMFVALLVPVIKKKAWYGCLALTAGLVHTILAGLKRFPAGWNIILAILVVTLVGALVERQTEGAG
ncbi:MAG TPA: AzlC family ABC transporter permease [Bacillota bacterium]